MAKDASDAKKHSSAHEVVTKMTLFRNERPYLRWLNARTTFSVVNCCGVMVSGFR